VTINEISTGIKNKIHNPFISLIGIILVSSLMSYLSLSAGHNWGDDFASYIMQAQSIIDGDIEEFISHNIYTIENSAPLYGNISAPWGFPLLLVPILVVWGSNLFVMKMVNLVFFALFLLSSFFLLRKRLNPTETLLIIGILAFHPMLLRAQDSILSDIPHLFFATTCILIIDNIATINKPYLSYSVLGLLISVAYEIRAAGILLLGVTFFYQILNILNDKNYVNTWKKTIVPYLLPYLIFFLVVFIFSRFFPDKSEYLSFFPKDTLFQTIGNSLISYFMVVLPIIFLHRFLFFSLLPFLVLGIVTGFKRDLILIIYILLTFGLNLFAPNQQGGRYLYPIILFLIYFSFQGIKVCSIWIDKKLGSRITNWMSYSYLTLFLMGALFLSSRHAYQNLHNNRVIDGPYSTASVEMFEALKKNTEDDSVIGFYKPRVMRMITDRDSYTVEECKKIPTVDYYVVNKQVDKHHQIPDESLDECSFLEMELQNIFENSGFIIFQVNP